MSDVIALIITKNEEQNIVECIKSLKNFCSRIVIVDSGSDDRTQEVSAQTGADVYYHQFETHSKQRNWGLMNCQIQT